MCTNIVPDISHGWRLERHITGTFQYLESVGVAWFFPELSDWVERRETSPKFSEGKLFHSN
jgi:hypothetical protein